MTTQHEIFDTKEQYIAFRNAWKALYANNYHKRVPVQKQAITRDRDANKWVSYTYTKYESPLTVIDHLLYAVGRGPAFVEKGFGNATRFFHLTQFYRMLWTFAAANAIGDLKARLSELFGDTLTEEQRHAIAVRTIDYVQKKHKR